MRYVPARTALLLCSLATFLSGNELPADLPALPSWSATVDITVSAGYRDNLLLSPSQPERSGLFRAEAELMALKVPVGAFDGYAYLNLAETRYPSGKNTDHERTLILAGEARWQPRPFFKAGWSLQSYHHDQVLDVSVTETAISTAQLQVTGLVTGPNVRVAFGPFWTEARYTGRRDSYKSDLDGYDEGESGLRLGWNATSRTEFIASAARRDRDHDSRPQHTASGRPLAGTHLATTQDEAQFEATQSFDAAKKFLLTAALGRQEARDNGSGYFNFDRDFARLAFTWRTPDWQHEWSVDWSRYDFPVQVIGIGINPETRLKRETRASWSTTRRLNPHWALVLFLEREQSRSNDDRSRFTVHTGYLGVKWSWDSLEAELPSP